MMQTRADGFGGMSNVIDKAKKTLEIPSMILNANVEPDGSLQRREGFTLVVGLPGAHSLWTNNKGLVLCMANGILYRIRRPGEEPEALTETKAPDAPVSYLEISGNIYVSSRHWNGMYDPIREKVVCWGEPIPATPILLRGDGGLPAGAYNVCVTVNSEYGRPSGNSPISTIVFNEDGGGFEVLNLPDKASVWMSDPNTGIMQYAGPGPFITELPQNSEPLPTLWGSPPPPLSVTAWAFGRVWGAAGSRVYYSEPYQPELFILSTSFFDMGEPVLLIAKGQNGMFFGCEKATHFMAGSSPAEMVQIHAAPGVIPGTLCYVSDLGELGKNVPVWLGKDGVYAGLADGQTINLIKDKVQINPEQVQGASISRVRDGRRQMLFSMQHKRPAGLAGQDVGFGDLVSCEVVRKGSVI